MRYLARSVAFRALLLFAALMSVLTAFIETTSALTRRGLMLMRPYPGWGALAGGSTALPVAGADGGYTRAELVALMKETAMESLADVVKAAMEPFTKAQADMAGHLTLISRKSESTAPEWMKLDQGLGKYPIGRKVRALALATLETKSPGDPDAMIHSVKHAKGWAPTVAEPTIKWLEYVKQTLLAGNASVAGDMVMPDYDPEWIELLRNNAVVRGFARTLPMPRGSTSRRKQTGAGTAYYQGETDRMTPSNQAVGREPLSYKKLTSLTVVGNDLIRFSAGEADRLVQEDLLQVMGLREDRAFLVGNPPIDAGSPKGMRYYTIAANVNASAGASLANFQADITTAIANVQKNNVPATPDNSFLIMSPSTFWKIYALATTTGDMIFAAMLSGAQPRLFGFPVKLTTQLEVSNSWMGANTGLIMFVHGPSMEIHDSMARTIATYVGGAYFDPVLAAVASGISNDETVITCIAEHDFFQKYDTAASIITGYAT